MIKLLLIGLGLAQNQSVSKQIDWKANIHIYIESKCPAFEELTIIILIEHSKRKTSRNGQIPEMSA